VDDKVLDSYVGTYDFGEETIVVSRVGRALAVQQNSESAKNELLAQTPERFLLRGSTITMTFQGDGGRIDRIVLEVGGQRLTATRRK
jgi:hypothetical protein